MAGSEYAVLRSVFELRALVPKPPAICKSSSNEQFKVQHKLPPKVLVHVVTFNHSSTIEACLRSVVEQQGFHIGKTLFVHVTDNASCDDTTERIQSTFSSSVTLRQEPENLGFTGGHNLGIALLEEYQADLLFILNPDVRLEADCLERLCLQLTGDSRAGVACPKLLRADEQLRAVEPARLDSTGMYITPGIRHFDRGSEEEDRGQYEQEQYVFGATGAAALFKKECLRDAAFREPGKNPELRIFDDAFFAYREDADLAWRLQWLGWKCRYVPQARGFHVRRVLPQGRSTLPAELNAYSVRNRFLLQLNNYSLAANWTHVIPQTIRNLLVIGASLSIERTSAPALWEAVKAAPRALTHRTTLLKRKRQHPARIARWFRNQPYAEPALIDRVADEPITSIHVIVVNYNSGARLGSCLQSLSAAITKLQDRLAIHVSVVDNASHDSSASRVQPIFGPLADFTFIASDENLGFAGGINTAARTRSADALLVINPDTILSADAIAQLTLELDSNAKIGLIAPLLVDEKGKRQAEFSVRDFPTLGSTLAELFYLHRLWPNNPWTRRYRIARDNFIAQYLNRLRGGEVLPHESLNKPLLVPQPAAACVLIRNTAFQQVQGFDSKFWPAWFEDVDFCKRLAQSGWHCAITASAEIQHEGGYSVSTMPTSRFLEMWYPNLLRYWQIHGSKRELTILKISLQLALLLRSAVQLATAGLSLVLGRGQPAEHLESSAALLRLACAGGKNIR